jgi:hypothetical protein
MHVFHFSLNQAGKFTNRISVEPVEFLFSKTVSRFWNLFDGKNHPVFTRLVFTPITLELMTKNQKKKFKNIATKFFHRKFEVKQHFERHPASFQPPQFALILISNSKMLQYFFISQKKLKN